MSLKIKLSLLLIFIVFLFPQKVRAEAFVYFSDNGLESKFVWEEIVFVSKFSEAEKAFILFQNLFESENELFVPPGAKVIGTNVIDSRLFIDVSAEFLNYGGTHYERCLIDEILKTAATLEKIDRVTILVEGESVFLSEGTLVRELVIY